MKNSLGIYSTKISQKFHQQPALLNIRLLFWEVSNHLDVPIDASFFDDSFYSLRYLLKRLNMAQR